MHAIALFRLGFLWQDVRSTLENLIQRVSIGRSIWHQWRGTPMRQYNSTPQSPPYELPHSDYPVKMTTRRTFGLRAGDVPENRSTAPVGQRNDATAVNRRHSPC